MMSVMMYLRRIIENKKEMKTATTTIRKLNKFYFDDEENVFLIICFILEFVIDVQGFHGDENDEI